MPPQPQWRAEPLLQLALGLVIALCGSIFVVQGYSALTSSGDSGKTTPDFFAQIAGTLVFHASVLGLVHWFLRCHETGWVASFGLNAPEKRRALRLTLLTTLLILPATLAIAKVCELGLQAAGFPVDAQASVRSLQATQTLPQRVAFAFTALLMAPLVEEILFRGILHPVLRRLTHRNFALWGSSFIFALVHANIPTLLPLTFLAVALALLYEKTGNLLAPVLAHALFNTANFILLVQEMR